MRATKFLPHVLVLLGLLAALGAAYVAARGDAAALPIPGDVPALATVLLGLAAAGVLCGVALLATRLPAARASPRPLIALALGGALVGGFAAFALMAASAESGDTLLASVWLALVLVALTGVGAGARSWRLAA